MSNSLNPPKKENPNYSMIDAFLNKTRDEEPIRKGCTNGQCFCTGACQEIIGWRKKQNYSMIDVFHNKTRNEEPLGPSIDDINKFKEQDKSHFEDIDQIKLCKNPEHNPPTHLHIPQGKRYIHICPGCKAKMVLQPPQISF